MSKSFSLIAAALGTAVAVADGNCSLAEADLDKIEAELDKNVKALADKDAEIATKDAKITELEAKVKDLEKEPATPTSVVTENGSEKDEDGPTGNIAEDVKFLMSL